MYNPTTPNITPRMDREITDEIILINSLQNKKSHPCIFLAFTPGNATNNNALDTKASTTNIIDEPGVESAPPIIKSGENTETIPRAAIAPITPRTPNINASQGMIETIPLLQLAGSCGALAKYGFRNETIFAVYSFKINSPPGIPTTGHLYYTHI